MISARGGLRSAVYSADCRCDRDDLRNSAWRQHSMMGCSVWGG